MSCGPIPSNSFELNSYLQTTEAVKVADEIEPDFPSPQDDADATRITPPPKPRDDAKKHYVYGGILVLAIGVAAGYALWQDLVGKRDIQVTAPSAEKYEPGRRFRDCETCPELVVVPPGSFTRGSPDSEKGRHASEGPRQMTRIGYPLAVGSYEVTFDEFGQFVKESGHRSSGCTIYEGDWLNKKESGWNNPGFEQTGRHPATCIAWSDAQAYIKWLSGKTNQAYRLLTSSEWEYIARSGIQASRFWGDETDKACVYGNVADSSAEDKYNGWKVHNCTDNFVHTAPAGSFEPNRFSVYDVLGNVFEWVEDCWNENYQGAPADGTAWTSGDCDQRVLRGGSWFSRPGFVRLAFRNRFSTDYRSSTFGFRVARVLE